MGIILQSALNVIQWTFHVVRTLVKLEDSDDLEKPHPLQVI